MNKIHDARTSSRHTECKRATDAESQARRQLLIPTWSRWWLAGGDAGVRASGRALGHTRARRDRPSHRTGAPRGSRHRTRRWAEVRTPTESRAQANPCCGANAAPNARSCKAISSHGIHSRELTPVGFAGAPHRPAVRHDPCFHAASGWGMESPAYLACKLALAPRQSSSKVAPV